jgi:hypothetical protein
MKKKKKPHQKPRLKSQAKKVKTPPKVNTLTMRRALLVASRVKADQEIANLERRIEEERDRRYAEFTDRLRKRRGAQAASGGPPPVAILAEGDSWFEYPLSSGSIIDHLQNLVGDHAVIGNLATHGHEVRQILGLEQRREIIKRLRAATKPDALLFSGGGNDLVGDQFCLWLNPMSPGATPAGLIIQERLAGILAVVEGGLRELIRLRDQFSPATKLFFHGYDFAQPSDQGVCRTGPWLKPSLDFQGIVDRDLQYEVTKLLLERLDARLRAIETEFGKANVFYVKTQGTLKRDTGWANEIHPNPDGFEKLAVKFRDALRVHWPHL